MSEIIVTVDNRVRLVAAVLAAGEWPRREQAGEAHAVHAQAKLTRQYVAPYGEHPAVAAVDRLLTGGVTPATFFTAALRCHWPTFEPLEPLPAPLADGAWVEQLADFYTETGIAAFFWSDHDVIWSRAADEIQPAFQDHRLAAFLETLSQTTLGRPIHVIPNLVYPALQTMVVDSRAAVSLILPPPRAVGESPPWRYGEAGAGWILTESCSRLVDWTLAQKTVELTPQQSVLLNRAATTLFLREALGDGEAMAYLVQRRRQDKLPELADVVERLRAYLEQADGRSLHDLV